MSSLTPVRQQLEDALSEAKKNIAALELELGYARKSADALEFILVGVRAEGGLPETVPAAQPAPQEPSITERVRDIIRNSRGGLRPRDVTARLRQQGVDVDGQAASNALWRLKNKTNEIKQVGLRYYWAAPTNGVSPTNLLQQNGSK